MEILFMGILTLEFSVGALEKQNWNFNSFDTFTFPIIKKKNQLIILLPSWVFLESLL